MAAPTSRTEAQKELFAAARQGDVGRCRTLLAAGDVEVNDVVHALSGVTALHAGVAHKAVVKLLIGDFRADVNARPERVAPQLEDDTREPWHLKAWLARNSPRRTPPSRRQPHPCKPVTPLTPPRATIQSVRVDHCPLRSVAPGETRTGT